MNAVASRDGSHKRRPRRRKRNERDAQEGGELGLAHPEGEQLLSREAHRIAVDALGVDESRPRVRGLSSAFSIASSAVCATAVVDKRTAAPGA